MEKNKSKNLWIYILNIFVFLMIAMIIFNIKTLFFWVDKENISFLKSLEVSADMLAMFVNFMIYISCMKINIYERFAKWFMVLVFLNFVYMYLDVLVQVVQFHPEYRYVNIIINSLIYLMTYGMYKTFWLFLNKWLNTPKELIKRKNLLVNIFCIIGSLIVLSNFFTKKIFWVDASGVYSRGELYPISLICPIILLLVSVFLVVKNMKEKKEKIMILIYLLAPYITVIITINNKDTTFLGPVLFLSIFMIYSNMFVHYENEYKIRNAKALEYKAELIETRLNLAISQIKPHFISNTLLLIDGLYKSDIKLGEGVMRKFVRYLQMNFSEMTRKKPVSVKTDIDQAKIYTEIAQKRWKDMEFEFKIECEDFEISGMTIQPLVENAVRHGLMPLEEGGKVTVSTYKNHENYFIEISDNGVGFDLESKRLYDDERKHIGISNISERLKIMCRGSLEIKSKPGEGTCVLIKISNK